MRYHFNRPYVDDTGAKYTDASIRLLEPSSTTPITDTIYSAPSGSSTRSQGWPIPTGDIDFYLVNARRLRIGRTRVIGGIPQPETYSEDIDVGPVLNWMSNVKDFNAQGDGVTDDAVAIQAAMDAMPMNGTLFFPAGTYIVGTTLRFPDLDGASFVGPPGGGTNRLPSAIIRAKSTASLQAIIATQEWLTNGTSPDTGQGRTIANLGFYGGGFNQNRVIQTAVETTAHTLHGVVIHGSGWLLDHVTVISANGHGIYIPGVGVDGSTPLSVNGSHENGFESCAIRWTGLDGLHAGRTAQDSWVQFCKVQYTGGSNFFIDDDCAAWSFVHNHPSWAAKYAFELLSGWNVRVLDNYIGSFNNYMDPGVGGPMRYAIYITNKLWVVANNSINTHTSAVAGNHITGIYASGKGALYGNTLIYQPADHFDQMVEDHTSAGAYVPAGSNIADTP